MGFILSHQLQVQSVVVTGISFLSTSLLDLVLHGSYHICLLWFHIYLPWMNISLPFCEESLLSVLTHPTINFILHVSPDYYHLALLGKVRKLLSRQTKTLLGISWHPQLGQGYTWDDVVTHLLIHQNNSLHLLYNARPQWFHTARKILLNSLILGML